MDSKIPPFSRRETFALAAGAAGFASSAAIAQPIPTQALAALKPPFALPPLAYAENGLDPVIDGETVALHHGKHHAGYVKTLNEAVAGRADLSGASLGSILGRVSQLPAAFRNAGGQHYAHSLYWEVMAPPGKGGAPSGALAAALQRDLGGIDGMKTAFEKAAAGRFGSGWAWLLVGTDGKLKVSSTSNGDVPLMDIAEVRGWPLLANDVWEHAYYLTYRNRRSDYLGKWWDVVNWTRVSQLYADAVSGR